MLPKTLTLLASLASYAVAQSGQVVFAKNADGQFVANQDAHQGQRKIRGKFLHITDIHPDPYFHVGAVAEDKCHVDPDHKDSEYDDEELAWFRAKGKKKHGHHKDKDHEKMPKAGYYGLPLSSCDGPISLMNATFDWIDENIRDEIDFIIWTGDNVRHDNDNRYPRLEQDIFGFNQIVSSKFHDLFRYNETRDGEGHNGGGDPLHPLVIPIIPSLGNNDVFPHNLYLAGPSFQSRRMLQIWSEFVPEAQQHIFSRGSYYFQEVITGKLAVISLNTLYFYKANPMSDGCDDKTDPGYKHLVWLGVVLEEMRQRGMKVWLSGHVPPVEKNYEDSCHLKLAHWLTEYRDIIVGSVFGHMNIDHFVVMDPKKIAKAQTQDLGVPGLGYKSHVTDFLDVSISASHPVHTFGSIYKRNYIESVREDYSEVPGPKKWLDEYASNFAIAHVSPSVIPNYLPSLRVWEYNITGLGEEIGNPPHPPAFRAWSDVLEEFERDYAQDVIDDIEIEWFDANGEVVDEEDGDYEADDYETDDTEVLVEEAAKEDIADIKPETGALASIFGGLKFWKSSDLSTTPEPSSEDPDSDVDAAKKKHKKKKGKKGKKKKGKKGKKKKGKKDKSMPPKFPKDAHPGPAYIPQLFTPTGYTQYYANITQFNKEYKKTGTSNFEYVVEYTTSDAPYNFEHLTVRNWIELARALGKDFRDLDLEAEKSKSDRLWEVYMDRAFVGTGAEYLEDPDDD
ncbi:Endopolyphosphatase [Yarrowia sp. B02]|nr:Endopolyphosphatase [Yarrowia sp. B02]